MGKKWKRKRRRKAKKVSIRNTKEAGLIHPAVHQKTNPPAKSIAVIADQEVEAVVAIEIIDIDVDKICISFAKKHVFLLFQFSLRIKYQAT